MMSTVLASTMPTHIGGCRLGSEAYASSSCSREYRKKVPLVGAVVTLIAAIGGASVARAHEPAAHVKEKFTPFGEELSSSVPLVNVDKSRLMGYVSDRWAEDAAKGAWSQQSVARVLELAAKQEGWRGGGSVPPSSEAVKDSLAMLRKLSVGGFTAPPMISADEEGALVFYWKADSHMLSFSLDGSGCFSLFAEADGRSYLEDDRSISDQFPALIAEVLSHMVAGQA